MKQALIVTDVQYDFLPGGALAVPEGDQIVPFILDLMHRKDLYELVVATQDWHPAGHGSFASEHPGTEPFEIGELAGIPQVLWPDHCVQGTRGAALAEEVVDGLAELTSQGQKTAIVRKGEQKEVDSYSAFFDNVRRHETELHNILMQHKITGVDIVGLAFDYCVKSTALDGVSLGYQTRVLMQGTRAVDPDSISDVESELTRAGVVCIHHFI